jgi:hypothetical protein
MYNLITATLIALLFVAEPWWLQRKFGTSDTVGVLMVYCRRSKWFRWLAWDVCGDSRGFIDYMEKYIAAYQAYRREK